MQCTCFRSEGFPSPAPSSEEEEVFDVSSLKKQKQKTKKQTKFIIHITTSLQKHIQCSSKLPGWTQQTVVISQFSNQIGIPFIFLTQLVF